MIRWSTDKSHGIVQSACTATAPYSVKRAPEHARLFIRSDWVYCSTPLCSSRISQPCGTRPTGSFASTAGGSRRAATPRSSAMTRAWLAGWSERVDNLDRTRTKRFRCWNCGLYPGSWSRLTSNGRSWSRQRRATRGTSRTGHTASACSVTTPCLTAYGAPPWRRPTSPPVSIFLLSYGQLD